MGNYKEKAFVGYKEVDKVDDNGNNYVRCNLIEWMKNSSGSMLLSRYLTKDKFIELDKSLSRLSKSNMKPRTIAEAVKSILEFLGVDGISIPSKDDGEHRKFLQFNLNEDIRIRVLPEYDRFCKYIASFKVSINKRGFASEDFNSSDDLKRYIIKLGNRLRYLKEFIKRNEKDIESIGIENMELLLKFILSSNADVSYDYDIDVFTIEYGEKLDDITISIEKEQIAIRTLNEMNKNRFNSSLAMNGIGNYEKDYR